MNQGEITQLYTDLCELQIQQNNINPECKVVYKQIAEKIKGACLRFTNQAAVCKTHFKKVPTAKARGKAKVVPPKIEDPDMRCEYLRMCCFVVFFFA